MILDDFRGNTSGKIEIETGPNSRVTIPRDFTLTTPSAPLTIMGWQCPLCKVVWAPSVRSCDCATRFSGTITSASSGGAINFGRSTT